MLSLTAAKLAAEREYGMNSWNCMKGTFAGKTSSMKRD
jgi:hypothetical protein